MHYAEAIRNARNQGIVSFWYDGFQLNVKTFPVIVCDCNRDVVRRMISVRYSEIVCNVAFLVCPEYTNSS